MQHLLKHTRKLAAAFHVADGRAFRLKDFDPGDTLGIKSKAKSEASLALRESVREISRLQEMLYAQDKWGVLLIFQAMGLVLVLSRCWKCLPILLP